MSGETPPTSEIQIFKENVEWSVPRSAFDTPEGSRECIQLKKFQACPCRKISLGLKLYPRSETNANRDYVSIFLCVWDISDRLRVKYKLGLTASDGTEKKVRNSDKVFSKTKAEWGWKKFIKRDLLFDPTKNYFRDDKLTIFCDLEVYWNLEVQVPESTLSNDWSELLDSGDFSDVVLVVGGEEIKAHKNVLSARSPVFAAMFKYNMRESQTGRVEIKDLDVPTVKALLAFVYSEEVTNLKGIAEKLLPAADKYGVERLKSLCEREICKKLTVENVVDMLSLAELHTAKKLKTRALCFISLNAAEVVEQKSFWDLNEINRDLFNEAVRFSHMKSEQSSDGQPPVKRRRLNQD